MRSTFLLPSLALGLTGSLVAQESLRPLPGPSPSFGGTFDLATGTLSTAESDGTPCFSEVIYNNSVPDPTFGSLGFFHDAAPGNTIIDEGRIPSISGNGPRDLYEITEFDLGYATNVQGPVDVVISFWEDGDTCDTLATLGAPTKQYTLMGLPGSVSGNVETFVTTIDVSSDSFTMLGDSNGIFGDGDWDKFTWGFQVLGQNPATDRTGPLVAGDPLSCSEGLGTFGVPGCDAVIGGDASGLDTVDSFRRANDGPAASDCYWFGGYPANPIGSFYLKLRESTIPSNDECVDAIDLGSMTGTPVTSFSTECATVSAPPQGFCGTSSGTARDLWYTWTAPADGTLVVNLCGSSYDTKLTIYSGTCGALVCEDGNDDFCGLQSQVGITVTAGTTYTIQVHGFGNDMSSFGTGDINIEFMVDPCFGLVDDVSGENDTCLDSLPVTNGAFAEISVSGDADWYTGVVCDGGTLTVDTLFADATGDIDLFLFDSAGGNCPGVLIQSSESTTDNESVSYTNMTGQPQRFYVLVVLFSGTCNTYDLVVDGECSLGERYCQPQNPNSTGLPAEIAIFGSILAADDDLDLVASQMPPNEFGYFVWSTSSAFLNLPASNVSDGFYCLGSGQGRFNGVNGQQGAVLPTGPDGTFSLLNIDTTAMPQSTLPGDLAITAGLTGHFQGWFRDGAGTNGNNFTDGCFLTWQ